MVVLLKKWLKRPIFGHKNAKNGGFLRVCGVFSGVGAFFCFFCWWGACLLYFFGRFTPWRVLVWKILCREIFDWWLRYSRKSYRTSFRILFGIKSRRCISVVI